MDTPDTCTTEAIGQYVSSVGVYIKGKNNFFPFTVDFFFFLK